MGQPARRIAFVVLLALLSVGSPLLADDESDAPHKGNPPPHASDTMRAFQDDHHAAENLTSLALTTCDLGSAGGYPCDNIDLLAFLPLADIGGGNGNDIWGWTDSQSGKEYALVGLTTGTAFVELSDPSNPLYLGILPPPPLASSSTWRDIKVYADHAFIVSEAMQSGLQIFDLTQLRGLTAPATFTQTHHYTGFLTAHNLVINQDSGFAYAVGTNDCAGGLHMVNIQDPANPVFAGCFSADGYTHDAQCVNYHGPDIAYQGQEICFNSNEDTLTIVDVTDKSLPVQLSRSGYANAEYTHQGWLTEDHAYFLLGDELDESRNGHGTRTFVWSTANLDNPAPIGFHTGTTAAIDHNQYVKGSYLYQANYRAGLQIFDLSGVADATLNQVASFDVYPSSDSANFNGAWSNFPFFDSGIVIVGGIEQGLFILRPNLPAGAVCGNGVRENPEQCDGTDFGGAVCGDYNCTGGALSCSATCLIDVSSCTECSVCDGDGICETGEDCVSCPSECAQGLTAGAACGNNVCETADGEDCLSCPADCNGKQSKGNPRTYYCCGSGSVAGAANAVTCDDSRCTGNGNTCTDQLAAPADYCCGDLMCSGEETSASCGLDCGDGSGSCELAQLGETCIVDGDCCTNKCRGRSGGKTCK